MRRRAWLNGLRWARWAEAGLVVRWSIGCHRKVERTSRKVRRVDRKKWLLRSREKRRSGVGQRRRIKQK